MARPTAVGIAIIASLTTCSLSFQLPPARHIRTTAQSLPSISRPTDQALRHSAIPLYAAPSPLPDTTDPFVLLGLDPNNPTADRKEIKRAYKRQAMRYHPDVVINTESSPEERKRASEEFAKINAAYAILSGKESDGARVGSAKRDQSSSGAAGGSGSWAYQPPHRRTSSGQSYGRRGTGTSTDWRDYMPNYDEEDSKYEAGDDSFSKIFSDLMTGVAAGAVGAAAGARGSGGGGILNDLIEFLEGVDGYPSGSNEDDSTLSELLAFGSLDDVSNEMDDTQLLVEQLETKIDNMDKDIVMLQEEVRRSMYEYSKYIEKIELEERLAEIEARKGVVGNYLKKARKRLVKLQSRYKELIVAGRADSRAGTGGYYSDSSRGTSPGSSSRSYRGASSAGRTSSSSYASSPSTGRAQAPSPSPSPSASTREDDSQSFSRTEGFGSFGRRGGRGTSRGRKRSRGADSQTSTPSPSPAATPTSERPSPSYASTSRASAPRSYRPSPAPAPAPSSRPSAANSSRRSSSITQNEEWSPPVPPHRRTGPDPRQVADDKKRLRDIKVDDEFDKLKKDLGL
mmetsp:Transcript_3578/g.8155  ORF Transcript_3578/g.8155 Transcript_3578/m.8155 type:complete len:569 (-) Transcript_3578:85-1791(-)